MRSLSLAVPALLLSAVALPAQTASYNTFGTGCASSVSQCPSSNADITVATATTSTHNTNIFAHPITPKTSLVVLGFRYFNKAVGSAPVTVKTEIYKADAAGKPKNPPVATSTMVVTPVHRWHVTKFSAPILIKPNEKFFISHLGGNRVTWSWKNGGTRSVHYWHPPTSTTWNGPFTSVAWAWQVDCAGGKKITSLGNTGVPKLGNSFSVDLSNAKPSTAAVLTFGASKTKFLALNLPLSMAPFGASGCSLNTSIEGLGTTAVGTQGTANVKILVPNSKTLLGVNFHNQFIVVDPAANSMGLSFSNGGTGVVGN